MKTNLKFTEYAILCLILLLAGTLRLYRVSQPVADWHSWRQADTASVTREYVKHGIDIMHPTFHDVSNIPSGRDNLEGYRMVEFPIVNATLAWVLRAMPSLDLVTTSRVGSILASLTMVGFLFLFTKRWFGLSVASWTGLTAAVLPYAVYYGRVILPEPYLLAASMVALFAWGEYLFSRDKSWLLISLMSFALALLLKPFALFYLPVFGMMIIAQHKSLHPVKLWKDILVLVVGLAISAIPLWWWRNWITKYPEGIPASDWLFNSNGIRLRPAWWRWLGYERITKLFLGYVGVVFFVPVFGWVAKEVLGLIKNISKRSLSVSLEQSRVGIWLGWWLGVGSYLIIIATGNVQHDYYQNLLIPIMALSVGWGVVLLQQFLWKWGSSIALAVPTVLYVVMLVLAWQQVKGYFNINHWEYVEAGEVVDRLLPADALVIAPAMGDTQFLFQTNRRGWPIGFEIEKKRSLGATHYMTTAFDDEAVMLSKQYKTIIKTEKYWLIDLTNPLEIAE